MLPTPSRLVSFAFRRSHLQVRVIATYICLMLAVLAGVWLLVHFTLAEQAQRVAADELRAAREHLRVDLDTRRLLLQRDAQALAAAPVLDQGMTRGDPGPMALWLRERSGTPAQDIALVDAAGKALMATSARALAEVPPVLIGKAPGEHGLAAHEGWSLPPGQQAAVQWAAAPVRLNGFMGWVVLSAQIDAGALAGLARDGSRVALVQRLSAVAEPAAGKEAKLPEWQALSGQLTPDQQAMLLRDLAHLPPLGQAAAAGTWPWQSAAQDGNLMLAELGSKALPLSLPGQDRLQLMVLSPAVANLAPVYASLERSIAVLSGLGLLAFLLGSVRTARWLLAPVTELTASARRVGAGDYETPIEVRSAGEVADLAQALENMRQAICQRERQVHQLAYRDTLTALPNREQFRRDLKRAIGIAQSAGANGPGCSVIYLDLDRFKRINDVLGQRYGDKLLRHVASRVSEVISASDIVARLGSDEFAVLLHTDSIGAQSIGARILWALREAAQVEAHVVDVSASIGIASCPEHGADADLLIARAERAMMTAKQQKAGMLVYEATQDQVDDDDIGLLSELRRAIDANQLRLVLQPKVDLSSGRVVGAEALVRWMHPERGELLPASFIPFAEQTGAVSEVTRWMMQRAVMACRRLHKDGLDVRVSVNLSARDLLNRDLPRQVLDLIERVKIKPQWMVFEITESELMQDPERARLILQDMHAIGVGLSIDDFGTGYSSLGYLKRLPVDELKIDKSFVMNMERNVQDAKIVRSTVDLAHNLGLRVVAEGLESAKSWKLLAGLNCDEVQGYFIAKPMTPDDFVEWARAWVAPQTADEYLPTELAAMI